MSFFGVSRGIGICLIWTGLASAQTVPVSAKIEAVPMELTMPERYQTRRSLNRSERSLWWLRWMGWFQVSVPSLCATVRESQEVAQLDRSEAAPQTQGGLG